MSARPSDRTGRSGTWFTTRVTAVYHRAVHEQHRNDWFAGEAPISLLSGDEIASVDTAYQSLHESIVLGLAIVLDSDELLLFHWSAGDERFAEDFYNVGLTPLPKRTA